MEQRRTHRFALKLPIAITKPGDERVSDTGLTRNISSTGILFTSPLRVDVGGPIEYVVTLTNYPSSAVSLRCIGKVVRSGLPASDGSNHFEVAATLERYEFERR